MTQIIDLGDRFYPLGEYPCPVCRHGRVTRMIMMDTFACVFCQHIFTTNFEKQLLKMADSQLPLTWYWNGKNWKGIQREGLEIGWSYFVCGLAFVILPTSIVAFSSYLVPTLPDSPLSWLPVFWSILTFFTHLFCVALLVVEYYQLPVMLYVRALGRRLFRFAER